VPPTGYPHLFRFDLELVTLRAKEVTVLRAYPPSVNFESVEIQFVIVGFAENLNHPLPK
jgi:hypothetical protein